MGIATLKSLRNPSLKVVRLVSQEEAAGAASLSPRAAPGRARRPHWEHRRGPQPPSTGARLARVG